MNGQREDGERIRYSSPQRTTLTELYLKTHRRHGGHNAGPICDKCQRLGDTEGRRRQCRLSMLSGAILRSRQRPLGWHGHCPGHAKSCLVYQHVYVSGQIQGKWGERIAVYLKDSGLSIPNPSSRSLSPSSKVPEASSSFPKSQYDSPKFAYSMDAIPFVYIGLDFQIRKASRKSSQPFW